MHENEEYISPMRFSKVKQADVYNLLLISNAVDKQHFIAITNLDCC